MQMTVQEKTVVYIIRLLDLSDISNIIYAECLGLNSQDQNYRRSQNMLKRMMHYYLPFLLVQLSTSLVYMLCNICPYYVCQYFEYITPPPFSVSLICWFSSIHISYRFEVEVKNEWHLNFFGHNLISWWCIYIFSLFNRNHPKWHFLWRWRQQGRRRRIRSNECSRCAGCIALRCVRQRSCNH